jgi:hypothetical protein
MFKKVLFSLIILTVLWFCGLMATKIYPYFLPNSALMFLSTKTDTVINNFLFKSSFFIHITSSLLVLLFGLFNFVPLNIFQKKHKLLGKVYLLGILVLAAPSGLGLALYANGGLVAKVGFCLQCIVWFLLTLKAFFVVKKNQYLEHVQWILRSYAVTLAALSLRASSYLMYYFFNTKPIETYLTVVWTSWVLNLIVIEIAIQCGLDRYLFKKMKPLVI